MYCINFISPRYKKPQDHADDLANSQTAPHAAITTTIVHNPQDNAYRIFALSSHSSPIYISYNPSR
jgi:hypothetical protein